MIRNTDIPLKKIYFHIAKYNKNIAKIMFFYLINRLILQIKY